MTLTEPQQITVLSVQTTSLSPVQTTVRFAIRESPGSDLPSFLDPVMLHGLILMHRQQVEEALSLPIVAVGPSLCAGEALCDSACDLVLSVGPDLYLVDGNSTQLAAPEVHEHARCECGPTLYEAPGACGQGYCLHGGVCRDTINGPKCSCPTPHDGPRCQQWSRGFQGGWAWFPPLAVCTPAHLSLEVRTARSDGLLLYNGPIGPPNPNVELVPDFISVELEEGRARLLLDLGSGTVNLTAPHRLDDDLWHRIDVLWDTEEVQLAVDWCRPVNGSDHVGCPIRFALPPAATLLNALSPLQLGGRRVSDIDPRDYGWSVTPRDLPLHGCLRNIVYNGVTLDLAEPALHDSTTPGCPDPPTTRCPRPPCGPRDPCPPGYVGPSCSAPTLPITLLSGGFVKYALSFEPDRRNSALQLRFRTRDTRAELFRLSDPRRRHFLILEISNGTVQARFCLSGQKPKEETVSLDHVTVSDGMWHYVKVEKQGSTVTLKLDDGEGRKHNESFKFEKEQLMSVDRQEGVYAGGVGDILFSQVCLDDVRVDGRPLPLPPSLNGSQWAQVLASRGAQAHCLTRSACADAVCPQSFACQDVWNDYVCTCGRGKMLSADGKACLDRNECLDNPCLNGGLCVNRERSAVGYACECPDGSWGQRCELLRERQSLSLGPGAVCAILGCLLLTLVLVALLVAYNRRREAPPIKKPDHCDDVRENIIGYNDEGGCEDDLHAFDLLPLKVELSLTDGAKLQVPELIEETGLQARIAGRRMREDRQHQQHLCGDDLRVYAHEGSCGSVAGSLSSLPSSDSEDEVLERLMRVGPRFTNILDIYACSSCPTGEESVV